MHNEWSKRRNGNWINILQKWVRELFSDAYTKSQNLVIYSWNPVRLFHMDHDIGNKLWIMRFPRWFWIWKLELSLFMPLSLFYYTERSRGCWYGWNSRYGHRRHKAVTFICKTSTTLVFGVIMLILNQFLLQSILSSSSCKRSENDISVSKKYARWRGLTLVL